MKAPFLIIPSFFANPRSIGAPPNLIKRAWATAFQNQLI
jgi:hypothetical protein